MFWVSLKKWWNRTAGHEIKLSSKHIIFGFYYDNTEFETINYLVLLAKWYLQKQMYLQMRNELYSFPVTLKHLFQVKNTLRKTWSKYGTIHEWYTKYIETCDNCDITKVFHQS